jgi:hypothetical protein
MHAERTEGGEEDGRAGKNQREAKREKKNIEMNKNRRARRW